MKMKKIFSFLIIAIMAICLVGCENQTPANVEQVSASIKDNTTYLATVISELESINSNDLLINEIAPISNINYGYTSSKANNVKTNQTNKVFDENTYTLKQTTEQIKDFNPRNTTRDNAYTPNITNATNSYGTRTNGNNYRVNRQSYTPRYVNDTNSGSFSRNLLDSYMNKIETLYNMCNDCVIANSELNNAKSELYNSISECQSCCNNLSNCEMTQEQIDECNSNVENLKNCCKNLMETKGKIFKTTNSFKNLKNSFGANVDALCTKYEDILNCVDSRILECKNAQTCLDNLTTLLNNCSGYNNILNGNNTKNDANNNTTQNQNNTMQNNNLNNNASNVNIETMQNTGVNNGINNNLPYNNTTTNGLNNGVINNAVCPNGICNNCPNGICNNCVNGICNNCPNGICPPYNNNGINGAYGTNYGVNNGYGVANGYNGVVRNTDTFGNIIKNTDTYFPNKNLPQNNSYVNPNNVNNNINLENNTNKNLTTKTPPPSADVIRYNDNTEIKNEITDNTNNKIINNEKNNNQNLNYIKDNYNKTDIQNSFVKNNIKTSDNLTNNNKEGIITDSQNNENEKENNVVTNNIDKQNAIKTLNASENNKKINDEIKTNAPIKDVKIVELANEIEDEAKEIKQHSTEQTLA